MLLSPLSVCVNACVCVCVRACAQRHWRLFDLIVLLERMLLSCFMTGAVGRYSASPASPQQSIIPLSADKRTPLILLLPLTLSETFKTRPRQLALARNVCMSLHSVLARSRFTVEKSAKKRAQVRILMVFSASDYNPWQKATRLLR